MLSIKCIIELVAITFAVACFIKLMNLDYLTFAFGYITSMIIWTIALWDITDNYGK